MSNVRHQSPIHAQAVRLPPYRPQLATPTEGPPDGDDWFHELMRDGLRIGCRVRDGHARLLNARGQASSHIFPELVAAAAHLPAQSALLDGEITILLPDGRFSGAALERVLAGGQRQNLVYCAYDLLQLDGTSLTNLPLHERKRRLAALLAHVPSPVLRYADHIEGNGVQVLRQACALGVAGIVSKHRDAVYRRGPSDSWVQTLCGRVARKRGATASGATHVLGVTISTPERPVYPALGVTKGDLAQYYADVAERMLPYVARRPLTLVRCERGVTRHDGLRSECKFLRHEPGWHRWVHPPVQRVHIREQKKLGEYLVVDSGEGLVSLVQGDILEIHVWNSTIENIEAPDRIVLDIDPGPKVTWQTVVQTALDLRKQLQSLGLASWPKLTGGKGLHVVVPFRPEHDWDAVYTTARSICQHMVQQQPKQLTLDFATSGRANKILLDYKRNHRAAVAVAAYSARAHPRGTVSMPIGWDELQGDVRSDAFDIKTARERLRALTADPWAEFWACRQRLRHAG